MKNARFIFPWEFSDEVIIVKRGLIAARSNTTGGDSTPGAEADVLTLENTTDAILLETGDLLLAEGSADLAITAMTAAASLADADVIVGVQGGVTESFALSDLKAYING